MNNDEKSLKPRILVVDDVPETRENLVKLINLNWDIAVDTASYGLPALKKLKKQKYDLIIVDYMMPDMTGYELTKAIRDLDIETPIILYTVGVSGKIMREMFGIGVKDFLPKPCLDDELSEILVRYLPNLKAISESTVKPIVRVSNESPKHYLESIAKPIERVLIVYGIGNHETLENIKAICHNPGISNLLIGHFVPIYDGDSPFGTKDITSYIPNEFVDKLSVPKDEQSHEIPNARILFERLNKAISDFQPDLIIFHSSVIPQHLFDRFHPSINRIQEMYPHIKITIETDVFDSRKETLEIVEKVLGFA